MSDQTEIRKQFWKAMEDSPFVMVGRDNSNAHHLPMTAQLDKHANHEFWFYHTRDGRLAEGGPTMVQFTSKGHDVFACVDGVLSEETDPAIIDRFWSKEVEAWYEGGRNDPNLLMLKFKLGNAEIWTADAGIKGMFKLLTGSKVRTDELGKHAEIAL